MDVTQLMFHKDKTNRELALTIFEGFPDFDQATIINSFFLFLSAEANKIDRHTKLTCTKLFRLRRLEDLYNTKFVSERLRLFYKSNITRSTIDLFIFERQLDTMHWTVRKMKPTSGLGKQWVDCIMDANNFALLLKEMCKYD